MGNPSRELFICTSQRLFTEPALDAPALRSSADHGLFQYASGGDCTIVCYNFALRQGLDLARQLQAGGTQADVVHANFLPEQDLAMVAESCARTRKLVVLDDSRTVAKFGDLLVSELNRRGVKPAVWTETRRGCGAGGFGVCADRFEVDTGSVLAFARG